MALCESSFCFQVSDTEMERWTVGNWTKWLFWSKLTWLGFHGTWGLRTSGLAKPFVYNSPQSISTAAERSSVWKIHAQLLHTCAVFIAMAKICLIPSFLTNNLTACDKLHVYSGWVCCQGMWLWMIKNTVFVSLLGFRGLWHKSGRTGQAAATRVHGSYDKHRAVWWKELSGGKQET